MVVDSKTLCVFGRFPFSPQILLPDIRDECKECPLNIKNIQEDKKKGFTKPRRMGTL